MIVLLALLMGVCVGLCAALFAIRARAAEEPEPPRRQRSPPSEVTVRQSIPLWSSVTVTYSVPGEEPSDDDDDEDGSLENE